MNTSAKLLRVREFAEALNVTQACVRRWLLETRIESTRIGRLVRIPATEVSRIISEGLRPRREVRGHDARN
jgi:excisionase family DNA binding protein